MSLSEFTLRQVLAGHSADVKCVLCTGDLIATGSRDATAKVWAATNGIYEVQQSLEGHSNFLNSIVQMPPSENCPEGAYVTGSTDSLVLVWDRRAPQQPLLTLVGHTNTVCSLGYSPVNNTIISGSYDGTARVWDAVSGTCVFVLQAHQPSVLAVGALRNGHYMTGGADKMIKIWDAQGQLIRQLEGHTDAVRRLIEVELGIASTANDGTVRVWTLEGECIQQYVGHESFVYDITSINGMAEFATGGEDQQVTIWKDGQSVQSIAHPGSVWSVQHRKSAGGHDELVTGCSDGIARIWTKDPALAASDQDMAAYLQDVQRTVAANQPKPQAIDGETYDYVWSVDVGGGRPLLHLGHNKNEDPMESAQRFLYKHQLSMDHLTTIVDFVKQNAANQVHIDMSSGPADTQMAEAAPAGPPPLFPVRQPVRFTSLDALPAIQKKITALSQSLAAPLAFTEDELGVLADLCALLKESFRFHVTTVRPFHLALLCKAYSWPAEHHFVVNDLFRAALAHPTGLGAVKASEEPAELLRLLFQSALGQPDSGKSVMTGCQAWASLFDKDRRLQEELLAFSAEVFTAVARCLQQPALIGLKASASGLATVLLNYAVFLSDSAAEATCATLLVELLSTDKFASRSDEAVFRCVVALGTLAHRSSAVKTLLKDAGAAPAAVAAASDERVKQAWSDLQGLLG